jgi:hypothetical protein
MEIYSSWKFKDKKFEQRHGMILVKQSRSSLEVRPDT